MTSWLPYLFPSLNNFTALRGFRALRPLRTISRLPGLRRQVWPVGSKHFWSQPCMCSCGRVSRVACEATRVHYPWQVITLVESLPQMRDAALLSCFLLVIFGVIGMQLFKGNLLFRCYGSTPTLNSTSEVQDSAAAHAPVDPQNGVCYADAPGERGSCGAGERCRMYGSNPLYSTVSFDSIGLAWMTIFQCITLEGWIDVEYMLYPSSGWVATVYFFSLVAVGSFYMMTLFLAVMWKVPSLAPALGPLPCRHYHCHRRYPCHRHHRHPRHRHRHQHLHASGLPRDARD